jgi:hypothetical protein
VLAPVTQIPPELDKLFVCVDHELPDHAQLKKSGLVSIHRGSESFDQLGGLDNLKAFCLRAMRRQSEGTVSNRPRGVLLGSLVGQSESDVRAALRLADAMAPCVLFCDEIEKGLAGATSSGQTDSGVTARVFGSLLTWLHDHESDVFFVGTCNDASKLPPEFARAERFDGRQDRGSSLVGLRSVPVGGPDTGVFAVGRWWWRSGAESGAGGLRLA